MGFLRRLFGGGQELNISATSFTDQRPDAVLNIVGEATYQAAILRLAGDLGREGPSARQQRAVLMREPTNPKDRNAIAVYLREGDDGTVVHKAGYLARELAIAYGPIFSMLSGNAILAPATLTGGWRRGGADQGSLGVTLNLGTPAELAAELWTDRYPPAVAHRWTGRLVAFTGDSLFAINRLQLDRFAQQFLARKAGCSTWPRVTKQVQVCVTSTPETINGNLRKAEEYGLELVAERDFWPGVGVLLDVA